MKNLKLVAFTFAGMIVFAALPASAQTASYYMKQAIEQFKAKNHQEAERLFGECLRVEPKNLECLYRRGLVREIYIGYGLALEDYTAALAVSPNNYILLTARGYLYNSMKRPDEGIADLTKALQIKPEHADAYYKRGNVYRGKGEDDKAVADYTQAVRFDPKKDLAYMFRASLYEKKGDKAQAIADYTSAIAANPAQGSHYYRRGRIHFQQGRTEQAEIDFKRAVELDPTIGTQVTALKRVTAAQNVLASLQANTGPKTPAATARSAGYEHLSKKEWDLAMAQLTKSIELEPNVHWSYIYRARAHEGKGDYVNALADFNKGISMVTPVQAYSFLAERAGIYFKQGKHDIALTEMNKVISSKLTATEYDLLLRGKIHARMGNKTAARADLEKAVLANPNMKEAKDELARL